MYVCVCLFLIYFIHYALKALTLMDEVEIIIKKYIDIFSAIFYISIIFNDPIKYYSIEKLL